MILAFDVTVSNKEIGRLARAGHRVVCVAQDGEFDETWVLRAINNGAEIIFSDDLDILNILDRWHVVNITVKESKETVKF